MDDAESPATVEAHLQRLESGKWRPLSLGGRDGLLALYADDFVTVEYGAELFGDVERKTDLRAVLSSPAGETLVGMLDATEFTLSEWRFLHLGADAILLSYRVAAPTFAWTAYATSAWVRRDGRWLTVFYQASRAKPA